MKNWRPWIGLLISGVFLYIAFRGQNFGDIREAMLQANLWWLPVALVLYLIGVWIRAIRWALLLKPVIGKVKTTTLFPIVVVGFMANNILPLRAGEIVRSLLVGRKFGARKTAALATIAVERIFDGLTMLAFLAFSMIFVSLTSDLEHVAIVAFVVFVGLLLGMFLLTFAGDLVDRLLQLVLGPLPTPIADRVHHMAQSFLGGLGILRTRRDLALVLLTSIGAWLFEASMYFVLAYAFGGAVRAVMGISASLLTTSVANLSTLIPGAPGYIGQFEYGVKLVLGGVFAVPDSQALAYAILVHAALFFPITIWGLIEWFRQELTIADLETVENRTELAESA